MSASQPPPSHHQTISTPLPFPWQSLARGSDVSKVSLMRQGVPEGQRVSKAVGGRFNIRNIPSVPRTHGTKRPIYCVLSRQTMANCPGMLPIFPRNRPHLSQGRVWVCPGHCPPTMFMLNGFFVPEFLAFRMKPYPHCRLHRVIVASKRPVLLASKLTASKGLF